MLKVVREFNATSKTLALNPTVHVVVLFEEVKDQLDMFDEPKQWCKTKCGIISGSTNSFEETDAPVTCEKCIEL